MKFYTITTLFHSENYYEVETFASNNFEDAQNIAKRERTKFKNYYFNDDDDEYEECNSKDYYSAWSNLGSVEFSARIKEHEI